MLADTSAASAAALAQRIGQHYPKLNVAAGTNDPAGFDLVVNATPLGMQDGDPLPLDVSRVSPKAMVGEVVMRTERRSF